MGRAHAATDDIELTLLSIAWKESGFDPKAKNPASSASGLYQLTDSTANDIQDRVDKDLPNPGVPSGGRLTDYRDDPTASTFAAVTYLFDRIASAKNNVEQGLDRFGTGPGYGRKIQRGIDAIKKTCGFGKNQPVSLDAIAECMRKRCKEIKKALD